MRRNEQSPACYKGASHLEVGQAGPGRAGSQYKGPMGTEHAGIMWNLVNLKEAVELQVGDNLLEVSFCRCHLPFRSRWEPLFAFGF